MKQVFRRVETSDSSAMFFVGQALEDRGRRERLLKFMKFLGLEKSRCFPLFPLFSNGNSPIYMRNRKDHDIFSIFFLSCFYLFLFFCIWCVGPLQASPTDLPLIEVKENDLSPSLGSPEVWNQSDGIWLTSLCIRITFSYRRVALLTAWCSNRPSTEATSLQGRE